MRKAIFTALAAFLMVASLQADPKPKKYYDREGRDYHEWNDNESSAYRHWRVNEQKQEFHEFRKAKKDEQRDYWQWRHQHKDWK